MSVNDSPVRLAVLRQFGDGVDLCVSPVAGAFCVVVLLILSHTEPLTDVVFRITSIALPAE